MHTASQVPATRPTLSVPHLLNSTTPGSKVLLKSHFHAMVLGKILRPAHPSLLSRFTTAGSRKSSGQHFRNQQPNSSILFRLRCFGNQAQLNPLNECTQSSTAATFGTRNTTRFRTPTKMDPTTLLRPSL